MDWQLAFNLVFAAFMGVCGWVLRSVHEAVQALADDLRELEKELPATYALKDDLQIVFTDIKSHLIRIEEKLDQKADK
jgi:Tfp pilus assembly protein PilO